VHLLTRIERHLRHSGTPPTRFGREAARDPRLVFDMRLGREPKSDLAGRLAAYLDQVEQRPCSR
jgi:hypothetical protein